MPTRREGKTFEPPPWEREQFEQLARERAPEQAVSEQAVSEQAPGQQTPDELDQALKDLEHNVSGPPLKTGPVSGVATATPKPVAKLDDAQVIEMLAQLSAEEPRPIEEMWRLGLIGAAITGAIGIMMVVFGVVGLAKVVKAGPMGIYIAGVLLVFGIGFCALAAWTAVRTLKQRGVL